MKKYGIDKLTTSVRIYKKDWEKVAELASQRGCNLTDATHELIENGATQAKNHPCNEAEGKVKIPGLIMDGNKIVGIVHNAATTMANPPLEPLPLYDPTIHKPGDKVRVFRGDRFINITVLEIDADGHPIPN